MDQATKAGVSEDAPELLRGRQLMHRLKLDEARAIVGGDFRNSGVQGAF